MSKSCLFSFIFLLSSFSLKAQFSHESEASMVVSGGNSSLEVYNVKTQNSYELNKNIFKLSGHYTYGTSNDVESARNWDGALRYDRELRKRLSAYVGQQIEGDSFNGIDYRYNSDIGAKYFIIKDDKTTFSTEAGYRYTIEKPIGAPKENDSKARVYVDAKRKHSESLKMKAFAEYIPNFTRTDDWLFNAGPSLDFILNSTFSLSLSYLIRYDHQPVAGNGTTDYQYTTGLIAKF